MFGPHFRPYFGPYFPFVVLLVHNANQPGLDRNQVLKYEMEVASAQTVVMPKIVKVQANSLRVREFRIASILGLEGAIGPTTCLFIQLRTHPPRFQSATV